MVIYKKATRRVVHCYLVASILCTAGSVRAATETAETAQRTGEALFGDVRQLIFDGRRSGEGYFDPTGSKLVFQSERFQDNPFYQIYLLDLETGKVGRVSSGVGKTSCAWIHPWRDRILFASTHEDPAAKEKQRAEIAKRAEGTASRYSWSFDEYFDIYEVSLPSGKARNLTKSPGYDAEGSWSPDGRSMVFASNRQAYTTPLSATEQTIFERDPSYFVDIYITDGNGENIRRLTDTPGYDGGPFFSPDGKRIVWRRFSEDGATAEIWTMNTDGSDKRQITKLGVMSWAPYYHPSGDYIIFANNAHGHGNFELYIVDSEGRLEPRRVTDSEGFDGLPVFSPDGKQLAWTSSRTADGQPQIFLAEWKDTEARKLLGLLKPGTLETAAAELRERGAPKATDMMETIAPDDIRRHLEFLSSSEMQGRRTGGPGERRAVDYAATVFQDLGLQPAGDDDSFFQTFEFTAGVSLAEGNSLLLSQGDAETPLLVDEDWRPLVFSHAGSIPPSEVVFAGYGISAPANGEFPAYDSYAGLDVRGRWVMVLRYMPENIPPEHRQHLADYFEMRYKAMLARDKGARGIIVVSGPNSRVKSELVDLSFDTALAEISIGAISVTDAIAERLLEAAKRDLQTVQDELDTGAAIQGFALPAIQLAADIRLRQEKRTARNVLARLPGSAHAPRETVIIGAHVDHIGDGFGFDSLAAPEDQGKVHPGADDNASGVASLLEIAQELIHRQETGRSSLSRDVVFAVWSGEELGLLGSNHFVATLDTASPGGSHLPPDVIAYLNLDMVGRLRDKFYLQGAGSSADWKPVIERLNTPIGLPVVVQENAYLPTDATSFYLKGVPFLNAFTGTHADYNTPRDTADKINYRGAAQIARLMQSILLLLATGELTPVYAASDKPVGTSGRRNLRAYLGTIPEYGENARGVQLNGVAKGSPAEQAGLAGGDIIVELAGRSIENIYDFTYGLNALQVGNAVPIVIERSGQRHTLTVVPASRE